jgi:hypothetical protein
MNMFLTQASTSKHGKQSNTTVEKKKSSSFETRICQPSGVYESSIVQWLDLSARGMTCVKKFKTLNWTSLIELNLAHNKIRSIESLDVSFLPKIQRLDLSFNEIQEIPDNFFGSDSDRHNRNCNLQCLRLEGNFHLVDTNSVRHLGLLSNSLTRISFSGIGGADACPLCNRSDEYLQMILEVLPKLVLLDYGSIQVARAYAECRQSTSIMNNCKEEAKGHVDVSLSVEDESSIGFTETRNAIVDESKQRASDAVTRVLSAHEHMMNEWKDQL